MKLSDLPRYVAEVSELKVRYGDRINLWLGAELDFIPSDSVREFQDQNIFPLDFDYFVGAVHFLGGSDAPRAIDGSEEEFQDVLESGYQGDIRLISADYYSRVSDVPAVAKVRVIGHFDLMKRWNADGRYFSGDEPWYRDQVEGALGDIAGTGVMLELNTAGWRKGLGEQYPATWILERCLDLAIPVTVSSDSHHKT